MPDTLSTEFVALQQAVAGRYSLERELGRGGMGIVFLARDVALDRLVAIKLLPPAQAAQAGLKDRFLREARTAAKLSHPNIVQIYVVEEAGGLVFFVMAYVEGETLGQRLRAKGPLNPAAGIKLLQEVAWALAYAHLRGIVHRDIKPDNILMEQGTGRAMVSDFGIARAGEASGGTAVGEILGTAQYMSPEQASGETVDGRSDIYSLGIVGFFALAGRPPFEADSVPALLAMQITRPAPPLSSVAPGVPGKVAQAIDKCLAKSADDRWPTGEAFAEALTQSTAVARDIPAPIRVWLTTGATGLRPLVYLWSALLSVSIVGDLFRGQSPAANLIFLGVTWAIITLNAIFRTNRVLAAGYTIEDLRLGLRQHIEKRREELSFEYDREPPLWAKVVRWTTFGTVTVFGASLLWLGRVMSGAHPEAIEKIVWLVAGSFFMTTIGVVIGRLVPGKRLKARDASNEYRLKILDSRLGRLLQRIASFGLQPRALGAGAHRPTEMAIGMAADQIFDSLPKSERKALKDLPALVRRLEAEAALKRARVEELNAMIAGVGDQALSAHSTSLNQSAAGAALGKGREQLREELSAKRDQAANRLSMSVAALENIRLDLLRLKAGVGTVDQLTADLNAARDLQREIDLAVEANREVEAVLRADRTAPAE
ncbi:MAG: protein kinase [Gemmatimonadales bacterium]